MIYVRGSILESKLDEAQKEKEKRQAEVTSLQTMLAEYKVRLEFLEKENERLKYK